jgi:hypothetical protein
VEENALREVLNKAAPARGNAVQGSQMTWREPANKERGRNIYERQRREHICNVSPKMGIISTENENLIPQISHRVVNF